jgi:hypothetical protein
LIGNFGDSHVSAFDPTAGRFLSQLTDSRGQPLVLAAGVTGVGGNTKGLCGIGFGGGRGGAGSRTLFFAAGPCDETDGVFGMVNVAPGPRPPSADVGHDLADARADARALPGLLPPGTGAAVTADLTALAGDLARVRTDLAAGSPAAAATAAAAGQKLAADLGAHLPPAVRHGLDDLTANLTDLAAGR